MGLLPNSWSNPSSKRTVQYIPTPLPDSESISNPIPETSTDEEMYLDPVEDKDFLNQRNQIKKMLKECNELYVNDQRKNLINQVETVNKSLDICISAMERGEEVEEGMVLKVFKMFAQYNKLIDIYVRTSVGGSFNVVIDESMVGMRLMDLSSAKILLVQIPDEMFKRTGYQSVEYLMKMMTKAGVVVVAVPSSLNILNITEEDLADLDLAKINEIREKSY